MPANYMQLQHAVPVWCYYMQRASRLVPHAICARRRVNCVGSLIREDRSAGGEERRESGGEGVGEAAYVYRQIGQN